MPGIPVPLRQYPLRYVTDDTMRWLRWHARSKVLPLRSDGVAHWPATLVHALEQIDHEKARRAVR